MQRKIRVLVGKVGLDGHDRGAKVIASALRDAGFEVIYSGLHQTPEMLAEAALQEDVDVIGISLLSGAHMTLVPRVLALLKKNDMQDVLVLAGGTIPPDDAKELERTGVSRVFGPGTDTRDIIEHIRTWNATRSFE
ncbi:MAG: cobalamin B12-binding domain-containing protein [candidate division KSB1 bacterium]